MTHLPIWYLGEAPTESCDKLIAEITHAALQDATMGMDGLDKGPHRDTKVKFADYEHWFSTPMEEMGFIGNIMCCWDYEINGREAIQLAQYGVGQHYNWHVDNFPLSGKDTDRKVTVVCLLNDPSDFEGGEFQIRLYQDYVAPLKKGSMIAFPSILEHRVTPVTRGVRMSATMWLNGPRFR